VPEGPDNRPGLAAPELSQRVRRAGARRKKRRKDVMRKIALFAVLFTMLFSGMAKAGEWYEKIKLGGDFRDRYDGIWDETKDYDRHRNRIRARLSISADITEDLTIMSRLATGVGEPASTNQTLTDAFSGKGYWLDQAYFDFHPAKAEGLHIYGGKMKNPFYEPAKQQLIWDNDVNPEGLAVNFGRDAGEKASYFLAGSWYSVMERKEDPDIYMLGAQGGLRIKASEKVNVTFGASYYGFENIKGAPALLDGFFGNTTVEVDSMDVFANDYRLVEGFGEIGIRAGRVSWSVWGAYVNNTAADSLNSGWIAGLGLKGGKDRGAWKLGGFYKWVEADGVIGLFADSDFGGGSTGVKGFAVSGGYALAKNVELSSTVFINERGLEDGTGWNRLLVDMAVKF
jgi:hypothetical protein